MQRPVGIVAIMYFRWEWQETLHLADDAKYVEVGARGGAVRPDRA